MHLRRGRELWTLARRLGLSAEEADDAVQEALARLWLEIRGGTSIRDPEAWTFRALYRLAMDAHRVRRRFWLLAERLAPRLGGEAVPDATVRLAVWDEVARLPDRQRAVLYLRYRSDFAFDDIAAILGITAGAARNYASTGVAHIRDALADAEGEGR